MAEKIISPAVFTRENDESYLAQGIGNIGAAIIGPFKKGPSFLPTIVNTQSEFEDIFGTPDGTYYSGYTVQNYLREAGTATIVRVGHVGGYQHKDPYGITITSGSHVKLVASLQATVNGDEAVGFPVATNEITSSVSSSLFNISGPELGVNISASVLPDANNDISDVFGTSAQGTKNAYSYAYFENAAEDETTNITNGAKIEAIQLGTQDFTNDALFASTPWIQSQLISAERSNLFRFHTLGTGNIYNKEFKISISNVKPGTTTDFPTFTISLRDYSDTDKRQSVKNLWSGCTLDPASPNYLPKLIGDVNRIIDANGKISENGDYYNRSNYLRVEVSPEGSYPDKAGPFGHDYYTNPIFVDGDESIVPAVIFSTDSNTNTSTIGNPHSGIDLETAGVKVDNNLYLNPIPDGAESGSNTSFSFDDTINIVSGTTNLNYELTGSDLGDVNKRQFTVAFQQGFDGISPSVPNYKGATMEAGNSQGFDLSTATSSGSVAYLKAINSVSNPDDYDINLVTAPGVVRRLHSYTFDKIVDMVEAREDAFFIGDVTAINDSIDLAIVEGSNVDSNYVGTYYPWVKTIDRNTNKLTAVPPSVLMPGIYANNDAIGAEWWAPAGLNRGGVVGAVSLLNRLSRTERDELYEGKINPIATFPGEGIVAFGQKTLQERSSALDRINVRRLLIKIKKYIASTSRYLIFEQNTSTTRNKFINTVNPYLEIIQQQQGLYSFKVVMDETNNTPDIIDRNILKGDIFIQPTKTAEFIVLDFSILPTGAQFSG